MQPTTDRDTTAWYLIHTKPRQEHIALTNLERQGYTCYLLLLRVENSPPQGRSGERAPVCALPVCAAGYQRHPAPAGRPFAPPWG